MHTKQQVNLGTLPTNTFPKDDGKVYIYKRVNGHLYSYTNGNEEHICCKDGMITNVPIFTNPVSSINPPPHLPDNGHVMLYVNNGKLYMYDNQLNVVTINDQESTGGVSGGGNTEGLTEW